MEEDVVCCPICGASMKWLTTNHLKFKHNMTPERFATLYPNFERRNQATIKRQHDIMVKVNKKLDKEAWKAKRWTVEHRKQQSLKFSSLVKGYWDDPRCRELMEANNRNNLANNWKNPDYVKKHKLRMKKQMSLLWTDSKFRETYANKFATDESWKQKRHDNMIRRWQDEKYRQDQLERLSNNSKNPSRRSYRMADGTSVVLRSSWEFVLYQKLKKSNVAFGYECLRIPYIYQGVRHEYIPDFYIQELNLILEVKPKHLWEDEIVQIKINASKSLGYEIKLLDITDIKAMQIPILLVSGSTTIESISE